MNGLLVEPGNSVEWTRALTRAAADPAGTIDRWRNGISAPRTMDDIVADYLALYGTAA